jgi:hypothetical protein
VCLCAPQFFGFLYGRVVWKENKRLVLPRTSCSVASNTRSNIACITVKDVMDIYCQLLICSCWCVVFRWNCTVMEPPEGPLFPSLGNRMKISLYLNEAAWQNNSYV